MKILITGATGFVGSHLTSYLTKKGYNLRCLVRDSSKVACDVSVVKGDIRYANVVRRALKDIDIVIHLAAIKHHYANDNKIKSVNVGGTRNVLKYSKQIKHIIFPSSFLADSPTGEYAKSKIVCEDMIKKSGLKYTILRLPPIFGKGDDTNFSKMISMIKMYPVVPVPGNGKQTVSLLHIDDLNRIIEQVMTKKQYGIYSVLSNKCTIENFIDTAIKEIGKKKNKIHIPLTALRFLALLLQLISKTPLLTMEQLTGMDAFAHIKRSTIKNYKYKFLSLNESIKRSL